MPTELINKDELVRSFHLAAGQGNLEELERIVNSDFFGQYCDINAMSKGDGFTALHYAAKGGHLEVVLYLFRCNANILIENYNCQTPLELLKAEFNYIDNITNKVIHKTKILENKKEIANFLEKKTSERYVGKTKYQKEFYINLWLASYEEFKHFLPKEETFNTEYSFVVKLVRNNILLLNKEFNILKLLENSPAAKRKIIYLIENFNLNINRLDKQVHDTVIFRMLINCRPIQALSLIKATSNIKCHPININIMDKNKRTVLMIALACGYNDIFNYIIDNRNELKLNLLAQDVDGLTIMHYAFIMRNKAAVSVLYEIEPKLFWLKTKIGHLPCDLLYGNMNDYLAIILETIGIEPERDNSSTTNYLEINNFPVITKRAMELFMFMEGVYLEQAIYIMNTNIKPYVIVANKASVEAYDPEQYYVFKECEFICLADKNAAKELKSFKKKINKFTDVSLLQAIVDRSDTMCPEIEKIFASDKIEMLIHARAGKHASISFQVAINYFFGENDFPRDYVEARRHFLLAAKTKDELREASAYLNVIADCTEYENKGYEQSEEDFSHSLESELEIINRKSIDLLQKELAYKILNFMKIYQKTDLNYVSNYEAELKEALNRQAKAPNIADKATISGMKFKS